MFSEDQESGFGAEGGGRDRKMDKEKRRRGGVEFGYGGYTGYAEGLEKGAYGGTTAGWEFESG